MEHTINLKHKCKTCSGTGLYVGFAEHDGTAVVCNICKGTGVQVFEYTYEDFDEKLIKSGVTHVIEVNPGITVGARKGQYKLKDFGGISYQNWLKNDKFPPKSEMRKFTCPAWWYQHADYEKKPDWRECVVFGRFSSCPSFCNKEECWERFDKENEGK